MKILFIGDIVGKPGRALIRNAVAQLVARCEIDLVVANVENAAGGNGITREIGETIRDQGIDVMTTGNHVWDKREALDYIEIEPRLIRPANFPQGAPGAGHVVTKSRRGDSVAVINVMGRVFMAPLDNPFAVVRDVIATVRQEARVIFVDFHAEATSEKIAMGWHLDGQVTAVVGTHTHVQSADERVLPAGTAYITDVGMTGPHDSVIGVDKQVVLKRFLTGMPGRFNTASGDPRLHGVIVTADADTGRATSIERLSLTSADIEAMARETTT
ncbi:MAG: TIGR00282 family metallophosphoesterase [Acidobacteria bacterium]|nr:TIGR00282 family metallophosphoesterase [Acidobacteriota bacterium]